MVYQVKGLFSEEFFSKTLNVSPLNERKFVIRYFTIDSRIKSDQELYCFIGIKGENFDGNDFFQNAYDNGIRVFVLEKSPHHVPNDAVVYLVNSTVQALADMASFHRTNLMIPHVAITGSVGKTTTRQLITSMLRQKYITHTAKKNWNNHIGLPLTILETEPETMVSILEAGMSNEGEIEYLSNIVCPDIAIITNIGLSHTEFLGSEEQVAKEKIAITSGMKDGSILLINKKDPYKDLFISKAKGTVQYFDPDDITIINNKGIEGFDFTYKGIPNIVYTCPIPGEHLTLNLAIMFVCAEILNVPSDMIQQGLDDVINNLGNRMRVFKSKQNIDVIADCYNASLESFKAALDVLSHSKGRKIAVIGDVLELGDISETVHRQIGAYISQNKNVDLVLCVGNKIGYTCQELKNIPYCHLESKEDIWAVLKQELKQDDTVLVKASNGIGLDIIVQCLEQGTI